MGAGIMGACTALALAAGGMRVVLIEKDVLGAGASGVNAGTLSLQIRRPGLIEYGLRSIDLWSRLGGELGCDLGFRRSGGIVLAFDEEEAALLVRQMEARIAAGLEVVFQAGTQLRRDQPALGESAVLGSCCPQEGFSSPSLSGRALRRAVQRCGIALKERHAVEHIAHDGQGFSLLTPHGPIAAARLVLAGGVWNRALARQIGPDLPIGHRVNQMCVTERAETLVSAAIGHVSGQLSLKQADNGTVLIGGGWPGEGRPGEPGILIPANLRGNLLLARTAVPALARLRLVRSWLGYDSVAPDGMPMIGELPGVENAFLICCIVGGYTLGPFMGRLLAQRILGREPDMPLFDPARFLKADGQTAHG